MNDTITIGEIIKHYRTEKGLSQQELAEGICTKKYISMLEHNKNIPTLDIINQLSQRLQINLYETYALMLRHSNIETHKRIELLNLNFGIDKVDTLSSLIHEYQQLAEFQSGEPSQVLLYAKAIYASNGLHDNKKAIYLALQVLSTETPFQIDNVNLTRHFSNVEMSALNLISVCYCRLSNLTEGKKYMDLLYHYIIELIETNHFATNRNDLVEIKILSTVVYNYFSFFKNEPEYHSNGIDKTLYIMKTLHCTYRLPQLLLCKTYLQIQENDIISAKETYTLAHSLGLYIYPKDYQTHIETEILGNLIEKL